MDIRTPQTPEEWKAYYRLRFVVLREPWGQAEGTEVLADEDQAIHAAAYGEDGTTLGVARLQRKDGDTGQVRCVAVSAEAQGKGVGKALMAWLEERAAEEGMKEIILEARDNAVPFYLSIGYRILDKSHLLFGIIQHYTMSKRLG